MSHTDVQTEFSLVTTSGTYNVLERESDWLVHDEEWEQMFGIPKAVPREALGGVIDLVIVQRERFHKLGEQHGRHLLRHELANLLGLQIQATGAPS